MTISNIRGYGQLGNLIVTDQPIYEIEDSYFPHDYFLATEMGGLLDKAVELEYIGDSVLIRNTYSSGFGGHSIEFIISKSFEIKSVEYKYSGDVIDGSSINYTVEKAIVSVDKNPYKSKEITGHYTIQIREEYIAGNILEKEGVKDSTYYTIFNGKFKVYSEEEIRNGKDWVVSQNEIEMGIKDSLGVYKNPDKYAEYLDGSDSLKELMNQFEISRQETFLETKVFVTLKIVVDETGKVSPKSMEIRDPMKSNKLLKSLQSNKNLLNNWRPAIYKGMPVKSELNLIIKVKKEKN